jgi:hypothetical protein
LEDKFDQWCVIELFGFKKIAGRVSEVTVAGGSFLRVDIPGPDGKTIASPHYGPAAIYSLTPTTEEIAKAFALQHQPEPVTRWELPRETPATAVKYAYCSYRLSCDKGILCSECNVYLEANKHENQGSAAGEEIEDEP